MAWSPLTNTPDRALYDALTRLNPKPPSDRVLIVSIDDASLKTLGPWPWPRTTHATLLNQLTKAGAAAVGYDVMFLEPGAEGGDGAFSEALKRSGRTVIPVLQAAPGEEGRPVRTFEPPPALTSHAAMLGQVNIAPDTDGVVRRVSKRVALGGTCWPQLAIATLLVSAGQADDKACSELASASRSSPGLLADRPELLPFTSGAGVFRTVSAAAVERGEAPQELIRGRIILVGASATGLGDRYEAASSGAGGLLPGVEMQANLLNAALMGARTQLVSARLVAGFSIVSIWALLILLTRLKPGFGLWALLGLGVAALAGAVAAFKAGWWASPFPALSGLALAYPLWSWRRLAATSEALGRELQQVQPKSTAIGGWGIDPLGRQLDSLSLASARLRDLQTQLAETLQSLPDPTVSVSSGGEITLANGPAAELAGRSSPVGLSFERWLSAVLGEEAGAEILRAFSGGAHALEVQAADGTFFEAARAPVHNGMGEPYWIIRLVDVSGIRQAVRQREEALQLLTHDIRAPFASISALIQAGGGQPNLLTRIDGYAARGRAMAESYVQFSRAENADWRPTLIDFRDAVIDAVDALWIEALRRGVRIETKTPDQDLLVLGDRALLTRALLNLMENAVRYSTDGQLISVVCRTEFGEALVEVRDEGPGVDPGVEARLFKRFSRGSDAPATSGAGLGLAMAAIVAQRMGGAVGHQRPSHGGAVFYFKAPLQPEPLA